MEEVLRIQALEDADGEIQLTVEVVVDLLHHHQRDVLVRDAVNQCVLQHVREGPVPDVVHQDGGLHRFGLGVEDEDALLLQRQHRLTHQVEGA